ncbi:MAG: SurA N-terminal domain-containing protein [Bdellovibrionales bacterium]|nr:SurA N-terminal domain-containing protein [Bdellovibrionales bacterium]
MLALMRDKLGPVFIGILVGFISFVFLFWGVWSDPTTQGGHAGAVNGEPVTISEFNRELGRRMEMYRGMNLNEDQIKQFRIRETVFEDLVDRRLVVQKAESLGIAPSDVEVRETIMQIPAFHTEGKFDHVKYEQLLSANRYTPASFENMVRTDAQASFWRRYLKTFVKVSGEEVAREFNETKDRRKLKFVYLTPAAGQKGVRVTPAQISDFLKDPAKAKQAQTRFDLAKETRYKGKKFEAVRDEIARDILSAESPDAARKATEELAARVIASLDGSEGADKRINEFLKPFDTSVKDSGWIMRRTRYLPGVGEAETLFKDAFMPSSPIDPKSGGKAKRFDLPGGILVAVLTGAERPDPAGLTGEERSRISEQLAYRKENDLQEEWMKNLREGAKVARNPQVFN